MALRSISQADIEALLAEPTETTVKEFELVYDGVVNGRGLRVVVDRFSSPRVGYHCDAPSEVTMFISYDSDADAIYVKLRTDIAHSAETREIDWQRYADYDESGTLIGVEFLRVSRGIDLAGVPQADEVAEAIRSLPGVAARLIEAPAA